jgi:hypothetical protein
MIGDGGLPAAWVWGHCDDFLIHAPTREKWMAALREFLDAAVRVGLLAHPEKLTPPAQQVKYTGLIFDTRATPCLHIPDTKRDKAIAMIGFAEHYQLKISRLCLAVLIGTLESLVDATPSRLGHAYLRSLQETLQPPGWAGDNLPYFSFTQLTKHNLRELTMWRHMLRRDVGRHVRSTKSGCLVPSFGDGSGTGTGGTVQYPDQPMEMWMGVWDVSVRPYLSNWKELRTLKATLERALTTRTENITGATFFYFTDNLVTYYVVTGGSYTAPSLHELVEDIKMLEIELKIHLEVIHIPGTVIIIQSTDGLSHGVWGSILHDRSSQQLILGSIFAPVPYAPVLKQWIRSQVRCPPTASIEYRDWAQSWDARRVLNCTTVWTPPPEMAARLIFFLLLTYTEKPLTTAAFILIPHVLKKRWSRMSQFITEIGEYTRAEILMICHSPLTIPICLLHIPPHQRVVPDPRMDSPTVSALRLFHRKFETTMRGLPTAAQEP